MKVTQHDKAASAARKAAAHPRPLVNPKTPMEFADRYFSELMRDPASVELAGILNDVEAHCGGISGVECFGECLQEKLAGLAQQVKRDGINVPCDPFNDAMCRLTEAKAVLDVLGQLSDGDHEGLQKHSLQAAVLLAERLVDETYDLLTTPPAQQEEQEAAHG